MPDCRFILDNLTDYAAVSGKLLVGSDAVDIAEARMVAGADAWRVTIKTVAPTQQNPRYEVSAVLYLDRDGKMENNANRGPRLGADTVYGVVKNQTGWQITKEALDVGINSYVTTPTRASFEINPDGYVITIPFSELPREDKALWRVGVGVKNGDSLTADYAPDSGYLCGIGLGRVGVLERGIVAVKNFTASNFFDQLIASFFAVAIIAFLMINWLRKRKKKI
jgi:hypothetical protein